MSPSLILACLWCVLANVIAMFPSRRKHWPAAYVLIAFGIPILAGVFVQEGVVIGLLVLAAAASILRWPGRYLLRWFRRTFGSRVTG